MNYKNIRINVLGISARVFSKIIGSNMCSVYNWENKKTNPRSVMINKRIKNLIKLFDLLQKNPDFLDKVLDKY